MNARSTVPPFHSTPVRWTAPLSMIALVVVGATAQGCQPRRPSDPSSPGAVAVVPHDAATSTVVPVGTPAHAVPPNASLLAAAGPYLIHRVDAGASDGDGVGSDLAVHLADGTLAATWRVPDGGRVGRLQDAISPDGRWLAYVTGDEPDWHLTAPMTRPLTLHVLDLDDGREAFSTRLLHDDIERALRDQAGALAVMYFDGTATPSSASTEVPGVPTPWQPGWAAEDVTCAFRSGLGVVAWSPASTHLAFIGALDGPTGDVYVIDVGSWRVHRASDEPGHAIRMAWSPDGEWILHEGSGWCGRAAGGVLTDTTDVSSVDGAIRRHVWDGSGTGGWPAWPDAWLGDHDAIVHHEANGCGTCDIVRIDVSTGISRTLVDAMSAHFAVDPKSRTIAIGGDLYGPKSTRTVESGVFVLDADDGTRERLSDQACRVDAWGAADRPFVRLPGHGVEPCDAAAFGTGVGDVAIGPFGRFPRTRVAKGGAWRVVVDERGWTMFDADGRPHASRAQEGIADVTFRPDGRGLFWGAGDGLWYADTPDGEARIVAPLPGDGGLVVDWVWWTAGATP